MMVLALAQLRSTTLGSESREQTSHVFDDDHGLAARAAVADSVALARMILDQVVR